MKTTHLLAIFLLIATSSANCNANDDPFIAMQIKRIQETIAKGLPLGSSVEHAIAFFKKQGAMPRYDNNQKTLLAPKNIEPEPRSYIPFELGLIKSFVTRCQFSAEKKLKGCNTEATSKRWD